MRARGKRMNPPQPPDLKFKEGRPPTLTGPFGRAWEIDLERSRVVNADEFKGRPDARLACWLVDEPQTNILWRAYFLSLVHLRPLPGVKPPIIHRIGSTHEIMVYACDPDEVFDLDRPSAAWFLHPVNYVGQFTSTDADAIAKVRFTVGEIMSGRLSPDTDFTQHWIARFGDSNIKGDPKSAGETVITVPGRNGTKQLIKIAPVPADWDMKRAAEGREAQVKAAIEATKRRS